MSTVIVQLMRHSQGRGSLIRYRPSGRDEDRTAAGVGVTR